LKTKLYITDEGFGPLVRQSAVFKELSSLIPSLDVLIQTQRHIEDAKRIIPGIEYQNKFNNIIWHKTDKGTPDREKIEEYYKGYNQLSDEYILKELEENNQVDFIISDFVYEAFEIANKINIPSFGIAHFTWDWFFSKFYPPAINHDVIYKMMKRAMLADVLFFPPYTPKEIIQFYGKKVVEVPLIVRHHTPIAKKLDKNKKHVLFIDSGSGVNKIAMETIAKHLHLFKNYQFYLPEKLNKVADNITLIPESELLLDYISSMDLVVGRAGFNTISECIACRTPMLLFGETLNPEMRENKFFVKEDGLGSFTSLEKLVENTEKVLNDFFEGEYDIINRNMLAHNYRTDGAKVIAEIIAETVCK
jgi:uncharacterized protein (TIGR00661 family)